MKEMWVLSVKTSLPNTCRDEDDLIERVESYDSFDKARSRFREVLKEYAFSENAMFDSKGALTNFDYYIDDIEEDEEEAEASCNWVEIGYASKQFYILLSDKLKDIFAGQDVKMELPNGEYTDCFLSTKIGAGTIKISVYDDGPFNGIDPRIRTNILDMTKKKNYYLHIDDMFGGLWGQECSAELYIDLKKTEVK